ncbi:MAG: F0F1 ATP synthase subunit epsilon [Lysobacterales bacterium]|jgi:F-type H+-transporting ATPase subunit epsilon
MDNTFHCDIVSAHREIFSGEVAVVYASGIDGELGIHPQHAPLFTQLKPGTVRVQDTDGQEQIFFVSGGLLEVQPHIVTIMADTVARSDELDRSAAMAAKAEAEQELANRTGEMEIAEAKIKLMKAMAQLQTLERIRKRAKR